MRPKCTDEDHQRAMKLLDDCSMGTLFSCCGFQWEKSRTGTWDPLNDPQTDADRLIELLSEASDIASRIYGTSACVTIKLNGDDT